MKRIVIAMDGPELISKLHRNFKFIEDFLNNPYVNEIIIKFNENEYKEPRYAWESMRQTAKKYFGSNVTCKVQNGKLFLKKRIL